MRKIIFQSAALLVFFSICAFGVFKPPSHSVSSFTYESHDYLKFKEGNEFSVVHDPECTNRKCKK